MTRVVLVLCGLLVGCSPETTGPWRLDNTESRISFVSTKALDVAEVHQFSELSGEVAAGGKMELIIELASVDTLIPLRDERMRELLFQTQLFPQAKLATMLDIAKYRSMSVGETLITSEAVQLDLHGVKAVLNADVLVTKAAVDRLVAMSLRPVIVRAAAFNMGEGVEKLREVAGLSSIGSSAPVSFVLTFTRSP